MCPTTYAASMCNTQKNVRICQICIQNYIGILIQNAALCLGMPNQPGAQSARAQFAAPGAQFATATKSVGPNSPRTSPNWPRIRNLRIRKKNNREPKRGMRGIWRGHTPFSLPVVLQNSSHVLLPFFLTSNHSWYPELIYWYLISK